MCKVKTKFDDTYMLTFNTSNAYVLEPGEIPVYFLQLFGRLIHRLLDVL